MRYCIKCGTPCEDTANFCLKCGAKIVKQSDIDKSEKIDKNVETPVEEDSQKPAPVTESEQEQHVIHKGKKKRKKGKAALIAALCIALAAGGAFGVSLLLRNTGSNAGGDIERDPIPRGVGEIFYSAPEEDHCVYDSETEQYYVDNEIYLVISEDMDEDDVEDLADEVDGEIVGCIELTGDYQIRLSDEMSLDELQELADSWSSLDWVESASPALLYNIGSDWFTPKTEAYDKDETWDAENPDGKNWNLEAIDAMGAWEYADRMEEVKVGVIDMAFQTGHEDLVSVFRGAWNDEDPSGETLSSITYGNRWHGTHVSGIIAADHNSIGIKGVAPNAGLYSFSTANECVLKDKDYAENTSMIAYSSMFLWKYALAIEITTDCRVINISMGQNGTQENSDAWAGILTPFLKKLLDAGYDFLIVQSAGNIEDSSGSWKDWYSMEASGNGLFCAVTDQRVRRHILIVGSVSQTDSGYTASKFSKYGPAVDVMAPGDTIFSTVNGGYEDSFTTENGGTGNWSGTSQAAPHVAGIAAMCFGVNPELSAAQVRNIIYNTAQTQVRGSSSRGDNSFYYLVNARKAVETALKTEGQEEEAVPEGIIMGSVMTHTYSVLFPESIAATSQYEEEAFAGAVVKAVRTDASGEIYTEIVEGDGIFTFSLEPGFYDIVISDPSGEYEPYMYENVEAAANVAQVVEEVMLSRSILLRIVEAADADGAQPAISEAAATWTVNGEEVEDTLYSKEDGTLQIPISEAGIYEITLRKVGYGVQKLTINIEEDNRNYPNLLEDDDLLVVLGSQLEVLVQNKVQWMSLADLGNVSQDYLQAFLTDWDQDGMLEVNTVCTMGSGVFTYMQVLEVNEDLSGLHAIDIGDFKNGSAPEVFIDTEGGSTGEDSSAIRGYYNPSTKTWYYIGSDVWRGGVAENGSVHYAFSVMDDVFRTEELGAVQTSRRSDGSESVKYTFGNQSYDSEQSYFTAFEAYLKEDLGAFAEFRYGFRRFNISGITDENIRTILKDAIDAWTTYFTED